MDNSINFPKCVCVFESFAAPCSGIKIQIIKSQRACQTFICQPNIYKSVRLDTSSVASSHTCNDEDDSVMDLSTGGDIFENARKDGWWPELKIPSSSLQICWN